jgi:hypothetical protein
MTDSTATRHEIGWTLNVVGMLALTMSAALALSLPMLRADAQPARLGA